MKPLATTHVHRASTNSAHHTNSSLVKPAPWRMPKLTRKLDARRFYVNPRRATLGKDS